MSMLAVRARLIREFGWPPEESGKFPVGKSARNYITDLLGAYDKVFSAINNLESVMGTGSTEVEYRAEGSPSYWKEMARLLIVRSTLRLQIEEEGQAL